LAQSKEQDLTSASSLIEFIQSLHGCDRLQRPLEDRRPGAIDLLTSNVIEEDPEYPDGEFLIIEQASGRRASVHSHKILDALILRAAQAWAATEGGSVKSQYQHLKEHLQLKTGFVF
jgi:hypothetical protein